MPGPTDRIEYPRADRIPSLHFIPQQSIVIILETHIGPCALSPPSLPKHLPLTGICGPALHKKGGGSYLNTECRTHQQRCDEQTSPHRLSSRSLLVEAQDEETVTGRRKIEKKASKRLGPIRASYILA